MPPRSKPKPLDHTDSIAPGVGQTRPLDATQKLADFLYEWSVDPIKGVRDLFGVHPTKQQEQLINEVWNPFCRVAVSSCTGAGKFLCNYERLHTPVGLKAIGDFKVGDAICNSYSGVSTVTGVYPQGSQHIYRVHFNNGTHVDSGLEHLWTVADYHNDSEFKTLSLESILDKGICAE